MNILEQIYEINFNKINFHERKIRIDYKNTIIKGPPKSGKSYLIYDYLAQYENDQYIYIDCSDYKNDMSLISKYIEDFVVNHSIEVLVLENYKFDITIPQSISSVIITTQMNTNLDGFEIIYVDGLDFEEYLLFDIKHQSSSNSFNSFLKFGNFPEIIEYSETKKTNRNYEISKLYCEDTIQFQILFLLVKNAGEKKSIFQLFNSLKKEIKISKDRFYKTCEIFEENRVVYFCEKFEQPKAVKKIFVHNHALLDIVSYKKNFNNLFKNMVYLELNKRYDKLYYLDNIDFYIKENNEIVLAIPFFNNLISANIISKILPSMDIYEILTVTIVTISSEESIFIGEVEAQIVPFHSWAVSL
jgi:predicted AAA+ superfamily ATPase